MAIKELLMPNMGESIFEATLLGWLKKEGEEIEADESVLEVATDKVDTEVPSPFEGKLHKMLAQEGDVVKVGDPIALIEVEGEAEEESAVDAQKEVSEEKSIPAPSEAAKPAVSEGPSLVSTGDRFYSPLVKSIAKEEGISQQELDAVSGSGKNGRVTKKDILAYLEERKQGKPATQKMPAVSPVVSGNGASKAAAPAPVSVPVSGSDEVIEMDRMRKMIAERMVQSKQTAPHVTSFVEADVTPIVNWRNKIKEDFKKKNGQNFTFMPIFLEAIAKAIRDFPMMNVQVDGTNIVVKKDINVGMAVALPSGNLIVPVIRNADQLNLTGLAFRINDIAVRARQNQLTADELQGGTYTVSNIGSFGNLSGTPIIMQPQVGILALGAIVKKPAVIETPDGDMIAIRHKMILSHSYDHRVVDGALGGMFVKRVAEYLESFDTSQTV